MTLRCDLTNLFLLVVQFSKMKNETQFKEELIAPCGVNCGVCSAYLSFSRNISKKKVHHCIGCRPREKNCAFLKKRCPHGLGKKINFCYQCPDFPCRSLETLDTRYREKYGMSMIENLRFIKRNGVKKFLKEQVKNHSCPKCGGAISVHNKVCFDCEADKIVSWKEKRS